MAYGKRFINAEDLDRIRINLSVRELKLRSEPSCDFCGSEQPKFIYAASRMSTGALIFNWRWLACETCARAVESNDWKSIEDKIILFLRKRGFKDAPEIVLRDAAKLSIG